MQLWVNLPAALKFTPPRYQAITGDQLTLLASADGGALVRLIAGDLGGHAGPGVTHTPITYAHATREPGRAARRAVEPGVQRDGLRAHGPGLRRARSAGRSRTHQLVVFGPGDSLTVGAAPTQPEDSPNLEVLLLGGLPIREPIAHYGPFLMNTRDEILEAVEDFQAGRMGTIPGERPRHRPVRLSFRGLSGHYPPRASALSRRRSRLT